ncbi:hypothetical protein Leryth_022162 [Lithospermum erythrorhizon]|nr:hypothetical protein Leryth_022162 [Lithospermum erythrorhizon]
MDPLTNPYTSLNSYCPDLSTLFDLSTRGAWNTILTKITLTRSQTLLSHPHHHLIYLTFNVLALTKLRRFAEAAQDLYSHFDNPENLDSASQYLYSNYPSIYPSHGPNSSMIPFGLRVLHAHLPFSLDQRDLGLDRLYGLLLFTRERQSGDGAGVWRKREIFVLNMIVSYHLSVKEFKVCLDLLRELLDKKEYAEDPNVVAKTGYVQMQYGDLEGARRTFGLVEGMVGEGGEDVGLMNLVGRNKALMYIVEKDYVSAVREYEACIERDGSDAVAINNKALCLMYLRDLTDGIKVLENALERVPTTVLNETIVKNLCSMYELAYVNHVDVKKTLSSWMVRVAPDDFDMSCIRV